jgi:predicted metallopeptidase
MTGNMARIFSVPVTVGTQLTADEIYLLTISSSKLSIIITRNHEDCLVHPLLFCPPSLVVPLLGDTCSVVLHLRQE